jgi:hypothetical protein
MAIYPVVHKETGETKVVQMSVTEIDQWYKDNPDWHRDWSEGCAGPIGDFALGEWKSRVANKNPGWKSILDKVKNTPKSQARDLY